MAQRRNQTVLLPYVVYNSFQNILTSRPELLEPNGDNQFIQNTDCVTRYNNAQFSAVQQLSRASGALKVSDATSWRTRMILLVGFKFSLWNFTFSWDGSKMTPSMRKKPLIIWMRMSEFLAMKDFTLEKLSLTDMHNSIEAYLLVSTSYICPLTKLQSKSTKLSMFIMWTFKSMKLVRESSQLCLPSSKH